MTMNKKLIGIAAAVIVVAGGVVIAVKYSKPKPQPVDTKQEALNKEFDPKVPNFVMGNVKSVKSPEEVEFTSGPNTYTAKLAGDSKIIKQVNDNGAIKNADAVVSDLKANAQIVVYFLDPPQNNVYESYKIQILN
jgi:hypothetical protein